MVGDDANTDLDFANAVVLSCASEDALMELINHGLRDEAFLGAQDQLDGGVVVGDPNITKEKFYFFKLFLLFGYESAHFRGQETLKIWKVQIPKNFHKCFDLFILSI